MTAAPLPPDEVERLAALRQLEVLDTEAEAVFDNLARLAATICKTPVALITFLDKERQWFKSRLGPEMAATSRDRAFCAYAIRRDDVMVVPDTLLDERFASHPWVLGDPGIRFYAGAPLCTRNGFAVGTICVLDQQPRELRQEQIDALRLLAHAVVAQLDIKLLSLEQGRLVEARGRVRRGIRVCCRIRVQGSWSRARTPRSGSPIRRRSSISV